MRYFLWIWLLIGAEAAARPTQDSLGTGMSLEDVLAYSLEHQAEIQQAKTDEEITEVNIRSRLADWYPQIRMGYSLQHNFVIQTAVIGGNPVKLGVNNVSSLQFQLSQSLFNRDVLLASKTRSDVRQQARQFSEDTRIAIVAAVSKAFYDLLSTQQQVKVADENILRIERSLNDALRQYEAGVADKTDYKRATIALNNARALRQQNASLIRAKEAALRRLMGFPESEPLQIRYDSLRLEEEAMVDTLQQPVWTDRVEYRLLETQRSLLEAGLRYSRWSFLPELSLNGAYNFNYQNNLFSKLYQVNYPNAFAALTLSLPLFEGGRRKADIASAQFALRRNREEMNGLRQMILQQHAEALAAYKGHLAQFQSIRENLALAREVYELIRLQYRSGIKTYLEVINAETDLRTAEINYHQSLYQLLASKVDLLRARGELKY